MSALAAEQDCHCGLGQELLRAAEAWPVPDAAPGSTGEPMEPQGASIPAFRPDGYLPMGLHV